MIGAIIQARVNSTRYHGKVFADLSGKPLIWHVVNRLKPSRKINKIIIATTENILDDKLVEWAMLNKILCFRGSENNVLARFYNAAVEYELNTIVRITADDPFKDYEIIDQVVNMLEDENLDFAYNNKPTSFPEGMDTEVFTFEALEKAYSLSVDDFDREHVTQFLYKNPNLFKQKNFPYHEDISNLRWTIDTELDYKMVKAIYEKLFPENNVFLMKDILRFLKENPSVEEINQGVKRSEMYR